jgi:hypothetical protein
LLSLLSNKKLEAFYFGELPRLLFWIGSIIAGFHFLIFTVNWIYGGQPNTDLLLPQHSGFVQGIVALMLSVAIPKNGLLTFIVSLSGPVLALFFYTRMKQSAEGITPKLPLEMTNLAISTVIFFATFFFIILTFRYYKQNKFMA